MPWSPPRASSRWAPRRLRASATAQPWEPEPRSVRPPRPVPDLRRMPLLRSAPERRRGPATDSRPQVVLAQRAPRKASTRRSRNSALCRSGSTGLSVSVGTEEDQQPIDHQPDRQRAAQRQGQPLYPTTLRPSSGMRRTRVLHRMTRIEGARRGPTVQGTAWNRRRTCSLGPSINIGSGRHGERFIALADRCADPGHYHSLAILLSLTRTQQRCRKTKMKTEPCT